MPLQNSNGNPLSGINNNKSRSEEHFYTVDFECCLCRVTCKSDLMTFVFSCGLLLRCFVVNFWWWRNKTNIDYWHTNLPSHSSYVQLYILYILDFPRAYWPSEKYEDFGSNFQHHISSRGFKFEGNLKHELRCVNFCPHALLQSSLSSLMMWNLQSYPTTVLNERMW